MLLKSSNFYIACTNGYFCYQYPQVCKGVVYLKVTTALISTSINNNVQCIGYIVTYRHTQYYTFHYLSPSVLKIKVNSADNILSFCILEKTSMNCAHFQAIYCRIFKGFLKCYQICSHVTRSRVCDVSTSHYRKSRNSRIEWPLLAYCPYIIS